MRRSGRLFIALGAGLALVAVGLVVVVLLSGGGDGDNDSTSNSGQQTDAQSEEPQEITVIVAARNIPAHTVIQREDLAEQVVLSDTVAEDVMRTDVEAIGYAYSVDLQEGQALVQSQRELPGLANRIEPGTRAIALTVDAQRLVGGQIRDDDRIDIIFNTRVMLTRVNPTYPLEAQDLIELEDVQVELEGEEEPHEGVLLPENGQPPIGPTYPYPGEPGSRFLVTDIEDGDPAGKVILQNVRVLRVVTPSTAPVASDSNEQQSGNFLILQVDPTQAELVDFLSKAGTYQIALRSPEDEEVVTTPGVTFNTLVDDWGLQVPKTVRLPEAEGQ